MAKLILTLLIITAVLAGIYFFAPEVNNEERLNEEETSNSESVGGNIKGDGGTIKDGQSPPGRNTVKYTNSGYQPNSITIQGGDQVTFVNESSRNMWTASAIHPTHTVYPGSSISKCGSGEENTIFDACAGLDNGEEWSFTFNEAGEWKYHNHLSPSHTGKIIVK